MKIKCTINHNIKNNHTIKNNNNTTPHVLGLWLRNIQIDGPIIKKKIIKINSSSDNNSEEKSDNHSESASE